MYKFKYNRTRIIENFEYILNSSTGLILLLISNFKICENITTFNQLRIKYTKLSHLIDSKITNDLDGIDNNFIETIINEYDKISEQKIKNEQK